MIFSLKSDSLLENLRRSYAGAAESGKQTIGRGAENALPRR
jgi:hypothetical protein